MATMLELPTVLTRRPPSESPNLPSSPNPSSREHSRVRFERRGRSPMRDGESQSTDTPPETSCERAESRTCEGGRGVCEGESREGEVASKMKPQSRRREPRWRELMKEWGLLLTLENSGSVARDHLASERTFLAYARTSLTIASTGVALVQLFTLAASTLNSDVERFARPLGAVMIGLGLFTLVVGVARYFLIQHALIRGMYPVARISPTLLSVILVLVVIVVFVIILVAR
ncbi:hypothetical protein C8T65DRAFT_639371 [Cerioporus squamosus]|nr:hypothetical protein C8T65DRAFT_639371 [Cerioporus squamosus]